MAKQASTILRVKNGPAEFSFLPSNPMTTGGSAMWSIRWLSPPWWFAWNRIHYFKRCLHCELPCRVRNFPESWGAGSQLWRGWDVMLKCAFLPAIIVDKRYYANKTRVTDKLKTKTGREWRNPQGSIIKQTAGCLRKEININAAYS